MSELSSSKNLYPRRESNPYQKFRKLPFYPLNYKGNKTGHKGN